MRRWSREAKRAGVPLLFAGAVCPKEVYPPADALQFCTTAFAADYDSRAALAFVKETAKEPVQDRLRRHGDPALARRDRLCRGAGRRRGHDAGRQGGHPAADAPTTRRSPPSSRTPAPNWVFSWAPWVTQVRTFEALRRLGWTRRLHRLGAHRGRGRARPHQGRQALRHRRQRAVPGRPADPQGDRRRGEEGAACEYPAEQMTEGWIAGMVIEAALKGAGWPADAAKSCAARWRT